MHAKPLSEHALFGLDRCEVDDAAEGVPGIDDAAQQVSAGVVEASAVVEVEKGKTGLGPIDSGDGRGPVARRWIRRGDSVS